MVEGRPLGASVPSSSPSARWGSVIPPARLVTVDDPAAATAPYIDDDPKSWLTISAKGGVAQVIIGEGGFLDFSGLVVLSGCVPYHDCNDWERSTESYLGPEERDYHTYHNVRNGECLSHTAGLLVTEPCKWEYENQWWSIQTVTIPCPPSVPLCLPLIYHLFSPWNVPGLMATSENGLLVLQPRVGSTGSAAQRLLIVHIPSPAS